MAASRYHQVAGGQLAAGIEHQPGDLLAQFQIAVDVVVIQAGHVLSAAELRQAAQQRLEGRRCDVWHAATQLHHILARHRTDQLQHLVPLGNVYRPLSRATHRWKFG
ncbi:hypothetical protein D3C76_1223210 [compost metagenome]